MGRGCSYRDEGICNAVATSVFLPFLWKQSLVIKSETANNDVKSHGFFDKHRTGMYFRIQCRVMKAEEKQLLLVLFFGQGCRSNGDTVNVVSNTDLGVRDHEFPNK